MARKLTKLVVNEISLVDRGAGEGVRVLYSKRNHTPRNRFEEMFRQIDFSKVKIAPQPVVDEQDPDNGDDIGDTDAKLSPQLEQHVNAMTVAMPQLSRQTAAYWLLHTASGRALAEHLSSTTKRKETPMTRAEEIRDLCDFAKRDNGTTAIAKHIITKGTTTLTEHEFTTALMSHCSLHKRDDESAAGAFARLIESDRDIRTAYGICKGYPNMMDVEPVSVEVGSSATADDSAKAFSQLQELIAEQRKRSPTLTDTKLYELVFAANPALVKQSVWHSSATT